jgi:hypothetical protein
MLKRKKRQLKSFDFRSTQELMSHDRQNLNLNLIGIDSIPVHKE